MSVSAGCLCCQDPRLLAPVLPQQGCMHSAACCAVWHALHQLQLASRECPHNLFLHSAMPISLNHSNALCIHTTIHFSYAQQRRSSGVVWSRHSSQVMGQMWPTFLETPRCGRMRKSVEALCHCLSAPCSVCCSQCCVVVDESDGNGNAFPSVF